MVTGAATTEFERLADASTVGAATHQLIFSLANRYQAAPSAPVVRAAARAAVGRGRSPSARQALRGATLTLASVYAARFWPTRGRLAATSVILGDSEIDLVWLLPNGRLVAQEIKTGMWASQQHPATAKQVRAQAFNAAISLGDCFAGVSVVVLRRPTESFFVPAPTPPDTPEPDAPFRALGGAW